MVTRIAALALVALLPMGGQADDQAAGPRIGHLAPAFSLPDTHGHAHVLEQYRGQWVVLEWLDYDCPYVVKHYRTRNLPSQQEKWRDRGVVWLAIVSAAPGTRGYHEPAGMNEESARMGSRATAVLLDPAGTVGRAYGATTTPQMFVIDPDGRVIYMGGVDDVATARDEDLPGAIQYVDQALTQAMAGLPVTDPVARTYGTGVRYAQPE